MRILFLCGREINYPRNQILYRAFKSFGEVYSIAEQGKKTSITLRSIRILYKALPKIIGNKFDIIFVGFYGYLLVPFLRLRKRTPIIFDAFVSNYDTLILDREISGKNSLLAKIAYRFDQMICRMADIVLLDTNAHAKFFEDTLKIPISKIRVLPVGAVDALFFPNIIEKKNGVIKVLYYCTYLPLHGVPVIVEAANLVRDFNIKFTLIGTGPEFPKVEALIRQLNISNIKLLSYLPLEKIAEEVAKSDICLGGHFGSSKKAERTIPGKIYQLLAAGKPIIASNTEANREILTHLENAYLCSIADPQSLAQAIITLSKDMVLRKYIGDNGRTTYLNKCNEATIQIKLSNIVQELISAQK
jgi:glycosyltransferase involved in cell wall biosynthesis